MSEIKNNWVDDGALDEKKPEPTPEVVVENPVVVATEETKTE